MSLSGIAMADKPRGNFAVDPMVALALVMTAGLGLRLMGMAHGFPDFVTGDERVVTRDAIRFVNLSTLQPLHFNYPALFSYAYSIALVGAYVVDLLPDVGGLPASVTFAHLFAPTQIALVGRGVNVLAGTGLIAVTYILGQRGYGRFCGLGGAAFTAVSLTLISHSRFALPDMTMALLACASCAVIMVVLETGKRSSVVAAGLLLGLAVSTKYNAGFVVFGLLWALLLQARRPERTDGVRFFLLAVATFSFSGLVGFLVGSPYWVLSFDEYSNAVFNVASNLQFSMHEVEWPRLAALWGLIRRESAWGVLLVGGVFYALYRRNPTDLLLLVIVIPAFVYIGSLPKGGMHYAIFLFPLGGILAARMLLELTAARSPRIQTGLFVCACLPQLWTGPGEGARLGQADVRSRARVWIEGNIPDGATVGVYRIDYTPPLKGDIHRNFLVQQIQANRSRPEVVAYLDSLRRRLPIYTQLTLEYFSEQAQVPSAYRGSVDLSDPKTLETFRRRWMDYDELKEWKVSHLILPSAGYSRFFSGQSPPAGSAAHYYHERSKAYIQQLFDDEEHFQIVAEFVGGTQERPKKVTVVKVS